MENQLYESTFLILQLLPELPTVKIHWKEASENMSEQELYLEIENYISFLKKHQCQVGLANTAKYYQLLTAGIQERFNDRIIPQYLEAGIKAIAFITSDFYFAQVGLEQILDEPNFRKISTCFFTNQEEALQWLKTFVAHKRL